MLFKRKIAYLLPVVAIFLSFFSPFFTQTASAYTTRDYSITNTDACIGAGGSLSTGYDGSEVRTYCEIESAPSDEARIIMYAGWLAECMGAQIGYNDGRVSFDVIENSDLQVSSNDPRIGHFIATDDGRLDCGKSENIKSALSGLGYPSLLPLLRELGCQQEDGGTDFLCGEAVSGVTRDAPGIYSKLANHAPHTGVSLNNPNKYYIALNTFVAGCKAQEVLSPTDVDYYALKNDSSTKLYKIKVLDQTTSPVSLRDAIYRTEHDRGRQISTVNESVGWDNGEFKCEELAGLINDNAEAYLTWALRHEKQMQRDIDGNVNPNSEEDGETTSSCAVEGVGWIVCPVLGFISNITDAIYSVVSSWLHVNVTLFDTNSATYRGWQAMRDIANTGFAIVFLIVIYSQLTGSGISNYGVKKMLPRLVIMAVAINASYYITQLMVDISNILGASVGSLFSGASVFNNSTGFLAAGNSFTDIGGKLMAGGAVAGVAVAASAGAIAYGGIGLFIMIILGAIIAVAVTLLILAARQAFIVILIVVSPLAFLAMILPNTKKWFDSWKKIFISLLVIYPMISLLFGATAMAASILVQTEPLLGLAVATIPLFAVIPMLKGSLNAVPIAGGLASKLAGKASLGGNIRNRTKQARGNLMGDVRSRALGGEGGNGARRATRWLAGSKARGASRDRRFAIGESAANATYTANEALKPGSSASVGEQAAAVAALRKMEEEEIANIVTLDSVNGGVSPAALMARLRNPSSSKAQKIAAVRQIETRGGMGARLEMAQATSAPELAGDENAELRQSIVASTAKMGEANPSYGGASLVAMQDGTFNATKAHVENAKSTQFSARSFLGMHPVAREEFLTALKNSGDSASRTALQAIQTQISNNPDLAGRADNELQGRIREAVNGSNDSQGQLF